MSSSSSESSSSESSSSSSYSSSSSASQTSPVGQDDPYEDCKLQLEEDRLVNALRLKEGLAVLLSHLKEVFKKFTQLEEITDIILLTLYCAFIISFFVRFFIFIDKNQKYDTNLLTFFHFSDIAILPTHPS